MRRTTTWLSIVALALATSAAPALANKPAGATKPPKPTVTKAQAPKSSTKAPKPAKVSAPKAAKASAPKSAKATSPKGSSKKTSTTTTASTTSTGSTSGSTTTTTTPYTNDVAKKLSTKPNHLAKLETALGLGTLTPDQINGATSGIKNFGQLNAMVNTVLNNPTVQFADLKALMTGLDMKGQAVPGQTTTYSLGQAKKQLGLVDGTETMDDARVSAPTTTTSTTTKGKSKKRNNTTSGGTQ